MKRPLSGNDEFLSNGSYWGAKLPCEVEMHERPLLGTGEGGLNGPLQVDPGLSGGLTSRSKLPMEKLASPLITHFGQQLP
ncbi:hypothetical protein IAG41_09705 [Sphingomonas sp. JC676]|uniref:hypothetical protein n=1 Tax=Sphingomonas sp. JC676 TaxID=2768065 RepID=UPI001657E715|nr:hypothetical protein [Sphingomonas sp. JC676]MBC9032666.1 hypothetical protein [Sphingomonas sp. JC676]